MYRRCGAPAHEKTTPKVQRCLKQSRPGVVSVGAAREVCVNLEWTYLMWQVRHSWLEVLLKASRWSAPGLRCGLWQVLQPTTYFTVLSAGSVQDRCRRVPAALTTLWLAD